MAAFRVLRQTTASVIALDPILGTDSTSARLSSECNQVGEECGGCFRAKTKVFGALSGGPAGIG